MDQDVLVLAGNGEGDVAFEVEVILASDAQFALDAVFRVFHRVCCVAPLERKWRRNVAHSGGLRGFGVERMGQVLVGHPRQFRRAAGGVAGFGDDGEHRLSPEFHLFGREDRLVVASRGRDVVDAGDVPGRQDAHDAGRRADCVEVHIAQQGVGAGGQAQIGVKRADGFRDVVAILGASRDMFDRAVVAEIGAGSALDWCLFGHVGSP